MRISLDEPEIKPVVKDEKEMEMQNVHKTFHGEMQKLKEMNGFKERFSYLKSYYKVHALIILLVIVCGGYILHTVLTSQDCVLFGIAINNTNLNVSGAEADLADYMGLNSRQTTYLTQGIYITNKGTVAALDTQYESKEQIMCYIMARQLDYAFCDEEGASYLTGMGICYPVKDIVSPEVYDFFKDRIKEFLTIDPEQDGDADNNPTPDIPSPVAIDLSGTKIASYYGFHSEPVYLVLNNLSGHDEELRSFTDFLYEIEKGSFVPEHPYSEN